jgi:hypothetical protein
VTHRSRKQSRPTLWQTPALIAQAIITTIVVVIAIRAGREQASAPSGAQEQGSAGRSDVTDALQLLLQTKDITSEVFSAPATQPSRWDFNNGSPYLLMRTNAPTVQPYISPSLNADKWDFGGGANTALNWSNWNSAATQAKLSFSYQNPYPTTQDKRGP